MGNLVPLLALGAILAAAVLAFAGQSRGAHRAFTFAMLVGLVAPLVVTVVSAVGTLGALVTPALGLFLVFCLGVGWWRFRERREHLHRLFPGAPTSAKRRVDRE